MEKKSIYFQYQDGSGQGYTSSNYPAYDASVYDAYDTGFKPFNGLEWIIIAVSIIAFISVFLWGLVSANVVKRDEQRQAHISQILSALDNYYLNSNTIPSNRSYPISFCDGASNSVDYELTLREHLTGLRKDRDTHVYIEPDNFPRDKWGEYSKTLGQRKIELKCADRLQLPTKNANQQIYANGIESCNFSKSATNNDFFKCYLYGTSVNGDKFTLAHYSETQQKMVFYSKFRVDKLVLISCVPAKC